MIGAMLATQVLWERVAAIGIIYFFGLGVGGHALDAIGPTDGKGIKPWGTYFSKTTLWRIALSALCLAYAIGIYYVVYETPLLGFVALLEGFFVFAYNLEWFKGYFHTDGWFSFSWGMLPVLAGYLIQTNRVSLSALLVASAMGLISRVEITVSRPYKELKRNGGEVHQIHFYETILKSVSIGVILLACGMATLRLTVG